MLLLAASFPTIVFTHPEPPLVCALTKKKEDGAIGGSNGDNNMPHVTGEEEQHDG
jgi:hypothetical protein